MPTAESALKMGKGWGLNLFDLKMFSQNYNGVGLLSST